MLVPSRVMRPSVVLDVGTENEYAWGDDIDARPKIGECSVELIDGRCTDGDGCRDTSRGEKTRVYAIVSGRDNDGNALADGVGHLWDACQRILGASS
jgi:hypothetical protein